MTLRASCLLGTSLLALGLGVVPERTYAADHELCTEYATQALEQYRRAQELGCPGLNYPVWSMDFHHHYDWCRTASEEEVLAGGRLRADTLASCQPQTGQGTIVGVAPMADAAEAARVLMQQPCLDYAARAVAQQRENLRRGCGFIGPQWNAEPHDHFEWCTRGDNHLRAESELHARQAALETCAERAREAGRLQPEPEAPRDRPGVPRLQVLDGTGFPGGPLMLGAVEAATSAQFDCGELRDSLVAMVHGGGLARAANGALHWQPAAPAPDPADPRLRFIVEQGADANDLNAQIAAALDLHRTVRTSALATEFRAAAPATDRLAAVTGTLSASLQPSELLRYERLRSGAGLQMDGGPPAAPSLGAQPGLGDLSRATSARIGQVCSLVDPGEGAPRIGTKLWEGGYAFVLGSGFGWQTGEVYLEYEACGGSAAGHCEDLRLSGQRPPIQRVRLQPISRFAWSDRLVGVRLPAALPSNVLAGVAGPRLLLRAAESGSFVVSPPVELAYASPHVWTVKTDSGVDPGGLVLDGQWAQWTDPRAWGHEIFWLWSQKIVQGAGWVRIDCEGCPKGRRVRSAHLFGPGDNVYIYGQGFGHRPGRILLTDDDPTAPGASPQSLRPALTLVPGGSDWWRDDRIHVRVPPSEPAPNGRRFPQLVIVDERGRWISGGFGLAFAPEMAIKFVSGDSWLELGTGEDDSTVLAPDHSSMIIRHPTGGCDSFLGVPTDTNESGADLFFYGGRPGGEIRVISAEFAQLDPSVSEIDFLVKWGAGVVSAVATGGPVGLLKHLLTQALEGGLRALGGDSGAYGIDPGKPDWLNAGDPRAAVSWTNTCVGLYQNQPLEYSVRFVVSGPRHLLYPGH